MNIVKPGILKLFSMDLESDDSIIPLSSDLAFRNVSKQDLRIATINWDWEIVTDDVAFVVAETGIGEATYIEIWMDLKEIIEHYLEIQTNDIIFLTYARITKATVGKDAEGKRTNVVTEYVIPRHIINAVTGKAVELCNGMEEF